MADVATDYAQIRQLVQAIHDSPGRVMIVTAGAGTQALAWLLGVAGASRTLLEALIPYDETSFNDFLGRQPKKYVAMRTAGLLAGRALTRALQLHPGNEPLIGVACTATIVTDRPKRGQHRAHIAVWTEQRIVRHLLQLHKGARDRDGEEELVSRVILNALAEAYDLPHRLRVNMVEGDLYERQPYELSVAAERLLAGQTTYFGIRDDGRPLKGQHASRVLLSGAFNPLHDGHLALAEVAADMLDMPVTFELAALNADKSKLNSKQVLRRIVQFAGRHPVLVSRAPRFVGKARLFPGSTFVVGYDTAERVLQPRFYDDEQDKMLAALREIQNRGCCFLVAGRTDDQGNFHEAGQLAVPETFSGLFKAIPASRFRVDISSTELRQRGERGSR